MGLRPASAVCRGASPPATPLYSPLAALCGNSRENVLATIPAGDIARGRCCCVRPARSARRARGSAAQGRTAARGGSLCRLACGQEKPFDLVIGADILYRQEHLDALLHTLLQVRISPQLPSASHVQHRLLPTRARAPEPRTCACEGPCVCKWVRGCQVACVHTEVLIAYKQRIKCDEAFFAAASRHFDITTVWSQPDARDESAEDGSSGSSGSWAGGRGGAGAGSESRHSNYTSATPAAESLQRSVRATGGEEEEATGEDDAMQAEGAAFSPPPDYLGDSLQGCGDGESGGGRPGGANRARPRVTGDWVSGASCCILRFVRRPPGAACEP